MPVIIQRLASTVVLAAGLAFAGPSAAVTITYQATDLPDVISGEDLWQYSYTVSGSFVQFGGFNILFSPGLYRSLEIPPPQVNPPHWSVTTTEPDLALPADGLYTATTDDASPSLADPFTVSFVWLGQGEPGSQPFDVFDETFFPPLEIGTTRPQGVQPLPLPGTLALLAGGFLGLGLRRALIRQ